MNSWLVKKPVRIFFWLRGKLLLAVLLLVLIFPLIYIFFPKSLNFFPQPSKSFWDNSIGNLLATVLALIAGIPLAFWIDRHIKDQEDKEKLRQNRLREKEILILIREELNFSYKSLFLRGKKGNIVTITIQPLKSDLWDALIASEKVKYITNLGVLNRIISVYYVLKFIKEIEQQAYIASRTSAIIFTNAQGRRQNAAQLLLQDARKFDTLLENSFKEALKAVRERLKVLKNHED